MHRNKGQSLPKGEVSFLLNKLCAWEMTSLHNLPPWPAQLKIYYQIIWGYFQLDILECLFFVYIINGKSVTIQYHTFKNFIKTLKHSYCQLYTYSNIK